MPKGYSEEPGVSGAQAVLKIRGLLASQERVESKFAPSEIEGKWVEPKDQIQVTLEDAAILEMMDDVEPYELTDGRFIFWMPFAKKGEIKAKSGSIFQRCWVDSAKEVYNMPPSQLEGQMITLEKQPRVLFTQDVKDASGNVTYNEDGTKTKKEVRAVDQQGRPKYFCFVKDEGSSSAGIVDYIKSKVVGLNLSAAMRALVMDNRINQFPEWKALLENDPAEFASQVGVMLEGERFGD